jgi:hypothetical protein
MKLRTFFKAGYKLIFLVVALFMSCSKKDLDAPVGPSTDLKKAAITLGGDSQFDEFKPLFEEVAQYIAGKQATISRQIMREQKDKTFVLSELFPEKSDIVSQIGSDGTPYEIGLNSAPVPRSTICLPESRWIRTDSIRTKIASPHSHLIMGVAISSAKPSRKASRNSIFRWSL